MWDLIHLITVDAILILIFTFKLCGFALAIQISSSSANGMLIRGFSKFCHFCERLFWIISTRSIKTILWHLLSDLWLIRRTEVLHVREDTNLFQTGEWTDLNQPLMVHVSSEKTKRSVERKANGGNLGCNATPQQKQLIALKEKTNAGAQRGKADLQTFS